MIHKYFLPLIFLIYCSSLSAQGEIARTLEGYRLNYLPEKVFVHTDKSIYAGGETIWAAVYLVDGQTHAPDSLSGTIHLELHAPSGEVLQRRKLYSNDGHTAGDITLPATLVPGDYQLTAFTNYQRNSGEQSLFRKTIRIVSGLKESGGITAPVPSLSSEAPKISQKINLRFFPEGGDCVVGIPCRLSVVAEDEAGGPVALFGFLAGPDGKTVTAFRTEDSGIGSITYTPNPGIKITAVAGLEKQRFDLPEALDLGIHLAITQRTDTVQVILNSNLLTGLEGTTILMHLRGIPLFERKMSGKPGRASFLLPTNTLPPGVITATVFDAANQPVAERLFFIAPDNTELEIGLKKSVFATRSPVELNIKMPVEDVVVDSLAKGRISLSVLPAASAGGPNGDDLRSWLLLNSDLDRPVPRAPQLLFAADEQQRSRKIEDYLLTREWRRFRWEALLNEAGFRPEHSLEQGVYLRGRMTKLEDRNSRRPGKVFLTRLENGFLQENMTDEEGYFTFGPYTVFDTLNVALQGRFKLGKKNRNNPKIDLGDNNSVFLAVSELESPVLPPVATTKAKSTANPYEEISRKTLTVARTYDSLIIDLQTIDVVTKRIDPVEESRSRRAALYGTPDVRVVTATAPGAISAITFLDFIRNIAGVTVTGNPSGNNASILIRGVSSIQLSNEPLMVLDGMPVTLQDMVNIPPQIIEFIDILKGPRAAAYGSRGSGGVILVYTKTGSEGVYAEPGLLNATLNGYHRVREFATFDATLPDNRNRPDFRTTLHWNADLRTNRKGLVKEELLTSDQTGKFFIVAQGLRSDGTAFFGLREFFVEE